MNNIRKNTKFDNIMIIFIIIFYICLLLIFPLLFVFGVVKQEEQKLKEEKKYHSACENLTKNNLYIVTKDDYNETINYYKVDNNRIKRSREFEYEENEVLSLKKCFEAYIRHNKVLNKLDKRKCKVYDENKIIVEPNDKINNIMELVSKLRHEFLRSDIIILNNDYYVITSLDFDLYTAYYLYKYENNKLFLITVFNDENIVALKQII